MAEIDLIIEESKFISRETTYPRQRKLNSITLNQTFKIKIWTSFITQNERRFIL